jgi:hypothetical protein
VATENNRLQKIKREATKQLNEALAEEAKVTAGLDSLQGKIPNTNISFIKRPKAIKRVKAKFEDYSTSTRAFANSLETVWVKGMARQSITDIKAGLKTALQKSSVKYIERMPQGVTELVILKADRKHFDNIIGSKFMIIPSEENAEDKRKRTIAIANNSSDLGIVAYYQSLLPKTMQDLNMVETSAPGVSAGSQ